jgi:hypothetical protein
MIVCIAAAAHRVRSGAVNRLAMVARDPPGTIALC